LGFRREDGRSRLLDVVWGTAVMLTICWAASAPARADGCEAALQGMNAAVDAANNQYHVKRDELGIPAVSDSDQLPPEYSCKWLQLLQYRRPLLQQAATLRSAAQSACSNYYDQGPMNAADLGALLAVIDARIPVFQQRCQAYNAQQPNTAPAQQSTSRQVCPPGSGLDCGNSTSAQPTPTVSVPAVQGSSPPTAQVPTVQGPSRPSVNVPVVQGPAPPTPPTAQAPNVPAPDPESAALAAFNQGKALYDAHNCAAALPYFNQAFSLTRNLTYGATYSGWADRAKECAQPGLR